MLAQRRAELLMMRVEKVLPFDAELGASERPPAYSEVQRALFTRTVNNALPAPDYADSA